MRRVLLPLHGFVGWNGGLDLVRLMRAALTHSRLDNPVQLAFAMPRAPLPRSLALDALRILREWRTGGRHQKGGRAARLRQTAVDISTGHELFVCSDNASGILQAATRFKADLVFPNMYPLGNRPPPRIGYIFDFQHLRLPHLFPDRIRENRNRQFRSIAEDSQALVVNSRDAASDLERFLGVPGEKVLSLPFTPYAKAEWFEADPEVVQQRHGIKAPYLLICNHFWMHKDHATAIRAFAKVRQSGKYDHLQLVMTGDPVDHRHPSHFQDLTRLASELGVKEHVHFLGLVPKQDQLALLHGSRLLLQPTHFEGGPGGGSVYEAVGMGVPAIVSDIPINREIDVGDVHFFRTGDAGDLSDKIIQVLSISDIRPGIATLLEQGEDRLLHLGRCMTDFFDSVLEMPARH